MEQLHGVWLMEIAELAGFKKADLESIKHYISKSDDQFRPAYGRTSETYLRQTVFWGTTNTKDFLRDSKNRRFNPIDVHDVKLVDNPRMLEVYADDYFRDQIWAEAVQLYKNGEPLILSPDAEIIAQKEQQMHSESDERTGLIDKYLNTLLPSDWEDKDLDERRMFLSEDESIRATCKVQRQHVCIAEIWTECMGKNKTDLDRYKSREYNDIMKNLTDWEASKSTKAFKIYGVQKYYSRKLD